MKMSLFKKFTLPTVAGLVILGLSALLISTSVLKELGEREIAIPTLLFNASYDGSHLDRWTHQICAESRAFASHLYTSKPRMSRRIVEFMLVRKQHRVVVDKERCIQCRLCAAVCEAGKGGCTACGKCVQNCPVDALGWW